MKQYTVAYLSRSGSGSSVIKASSHTDAKAKYEAKNRGLHPLQPGAMRGDGVAGLKKQILSSNSRIQSSKSAARGFHYFKNYRTRILFFCGDLDLSPVTPTH